MAGGLEQLAGGLVDSIMGVGETAFESQLAGLVGGVPAEPDHGLRRPNRVERQRRYLVLASRVVRRAVDSKLIADTPVQVPAGLDALDRRVVNIERLEFGIATDRVDADVDLGLDEVIVVGPECGNARRGACALPAQSDVETNR